VTGGASGQTVHRWRRALYEWRNVGLRLAEVASSRTNDGLFTRRRKIFFFQKSHDAFNSSIPECRVSFLVQPTATELVTQQPNGGSKRLPLASNACFRSTRLSLSHCMGQPFVQNEARCVRLSRLFTCAFLQVTTCD
jgi:hypothetical protein